MQLLQLIPSNTKGGSPMESSRINIIENRSKTAIVTEKFAILYQDVRIKSG